MSAQTDNLDKQSVDVVPQEKRIDEISENWIGSDVDRRRFSNRKRKGVDLLSYDDAFRGVAESNTTRKREKVATKTSETKGESKVITQHARFRVGQEVVLNCGVKENPSFNGEVFVIKRILEGNYVLEMANPCDGLWGGPITKSAAFMERYFSFFSKKITNAHQKSCFDNHVASQYPLNSSRIQTAKCSI